MIAKHLALQERKEKLELVRRLVSLGRDDVSDRVYCMAQVAEKLDSLVKLQRDKQQQQHGGRNRQDARRGLFGMF